MGLHGFFQKVVVQGKPSSCYSLCRRGPGLLSVTAPMTLCEHREGKLADNLVTLCEHREGKLADNLVTLCEQCEHKLTDSLVTPCEQCEHKLTDSLVTLCERRLRISPFSSCPAHHCTTYYTPVLPGSEQTSYPNHPSQNDYKPKESSGSPYHCSVCVTFMSFLPLMHFY